MTTDQMAYFLELARRLNFTAAAEALFITQPTLSRQIGNLEKELGVELFIRKSNSVCLTAAGLELMQGLRTIYNDYTTLTKRVYQLGCGDSGALTLGVSEEQLLPPAVLDALARFQSQCPNVNLTIRRCAPNSIRMALLEGSLDLACCITSPLHPPAGLKQVTLMDESPVLAIAERLFPDETDTLSMEQFNQLLRRYPLLLPSNDNFNYPAHDPVGHLCQCFGLETVPPKVQLVPQITAIPFQVEAGLGFSIVNPSNLVSTLPGVRMLPIGWKYNELYRASLLYSSRSAGLLTARFVSLLQDLPQPCAPCP